MRIKLFVAFLFGFIFYTHTQPAVRTTISSDDYRFGGSMTDEILQNLRPVEQKAYLIALDSLGLKNDSIWCCLLRICLKQECEIMYYIVFYLNTNIIIKL